MLAIIYLLLSFYAGYNLVKLLFPILFTVSDWKCLGKKGGTACRLPVWMVTAPASLVIGLIIITWPTYLISYLFRKTEEPMLYGNISVFVIFLALIFVLMFINKHKHIKNQTTMLNKDRICLLSGLFSNMKNQTTMLNKDRICLFLSGLCNNKRAPIKISTECIFTIVSFLISVFIMFLTFNSKNGSMCIGPDVWSDFGPHIAMIRSFSFGQNFPTNYPHFYGTGDVKYHFMFQFLAANLEFLGLRIDWAFNLPSILTFFSFLLLLYSFAVILTGKKAIGVITAILFFFRSSFAFFTFLGDVFRDYPANSPGFFKGLLHYFNIAISQILSNTNYIGKTQHEDWGLWTQKVYVNQRHLAIGLAVMLLLMILVYPLFKKGISRLYKTARLNEGKPFSVYIKEAVRELFFCFDAWIPMSITNSVAAGALLGMPGFFNGAVVIGTLPVLLIISIFSKHKLQFLNIALITILLSYCQSLFFINDTAPVKPELYFGFLSEGAGSVNFNLQGTVLFYIEMMGILIPFVILAAFFVPKGLRWLTLAFFTPLLMATFVKLTVEITANHKFIIMSMILINITAAALFYKLYRLPKSNRSVLTGRFTRPIFYKIKKVALFPVVFSLAFVITVTGVVDFITLINSNLNRGITTDNDLPIVYWIRENTNSHDLFLTGSDVLNPALLAGRGIFYGHPYYAWSAGYDTYKRADIQQAIFSETSVDKLKNMVLENKINYILINDWMRGSEEKPNEFLIAKVFNKAIAFNYLNTIIYKTNGNTSDNKSFTHYGIGSIETINPSKAVIVLFSGLAAVLALALLEFMAIKAYRRKLPLSQYDYAYLIKPEE